MTIAEIVAPKRRAWRGTLALRVVLSIALSFVITGILILMAGKNPLVAYQQIVLGALGSWPRIVVGLNKAAPYMLAGIGVALCFRGNVANMGAEGQIAIGGLAASFVALVGATTLGAAVLPAAILAGILGGALWAVIAAAINLTRGVHEVLVTLMMNFACTLFGLTPEEALAGATCHAAAALGLDDRGVLEPGRRAEFAVWDLDDPAALSYAISGKRPVRVGFPGKGAP